MSDRGDDGAPPRKPYAGGPRPDLRSTIYIGNLPEGTEPEDVTACFEDAGFEVKEVSIPYDRSMHRWKPFGFVALQDEEDVDDAVKKMNGCELRGRNIRVEKRDPNPDPERSWRPGDRESGRGGRQQSRGRGGGRRRDSRDYRRRRDSRRGRGGRRDSRSRGRRR